MSGIPLVRESEATDERAREAFRDIKSTMRIPVIALLFWNHVFVMVWRAGRSPITLRHFGREH